MTIATATDFRKELQSRKKDCAVDREYREIQAWVSERIECLRSVRKLDQDWTKRILDGKTAFDEAVARELYGYYEEWYSDFEDVDKRVAGLAERGRAVFGAMEHRKAAEEVQTILRSMSVDELVEAMSG